MSEVISVEQIIYEKDQNHFLTYAELSSLNPDFATDKYTLTSFNTNVSGVGTMTAPGDKMYYPAYDDIVLYAQWKKNEVLYYLIGTNDKYSIEQSETEITEYQYEFLEGDYYRTLEIDIDGTTDEGMVLSKITIDCKNECVDDGSFSFNVHYQKDSASNWVDEKSITYSPQSEKSTHNEYTVYTSGKEGTKITMSGGIGGGDGKTLMYLLIKFTYTSP